LVSIYLEASGQGHGEPDSEEDSDTDDVVPTRPPELAVCVNDKAVQHQPSAQRNEEARQGAAPPAYEGDSYCHDGELGTPVHIFAGDALACAGDRDSHTESHAEGHDADERVGQAGICGAEWPAMDDEGARPAVRQWQHSGLLSNRCPKRATDSVKLYACPAACFLMEP
jgi:hypothetical protein